MSLIGNLEEIKIADVLRLFAQGKKTGRLTVTDAEEQTTLRFQKGVVVHANASHGRLAGEDAVLDLFGWKAGQLTFIPEEKSVTPNVTRGVDQLVLDGLRLGDVFHRMNEAIPSDRAVFQMGAGPADEEKRLAIGSRDWRVLRLCDGSRDVRELAESTRLPRNDVMRIVFEALEAGFLERVEAQRGLRVQVLGLFGKEQAEIDPRLEDEWRRLLHFGRGVKRVEVRSGPGRSAALPAVFKAGLVREIHLPRNVFAELGLREGEDVSVKPVD
jgi:DNA-binding MarR family transcriptional regulator